MARKAVRVPGWAEVIPTFDDQHMDPDPITWEIRGMPSATHTAWGLEMFTGKNTAIAEAEEKDSKRAKAVRVAEKKKAIEDGDANALEDVSPTPYALTLVVKNCVRNIKNYEDSEGRPIRTGHDLVTKGEAAAITDAYMAVITRSFLTEELAKNLPKQPGS